MSVYKEPNEEIDLVLEKRKNDFLKERDTWTKVPDHPEDKKEYTVGCYEEDDWKYIHEILMQDGTLEDNIPSRHVDCTNHFNHSPTRGTYLLDDMEVEALKQHPKVRYVNINHSAYPGSFTDNPDDFVLSLTKTNRYPAPGPWAQGYLYSNNYTSTTIVPDMATHYNRSSGQLIRHQEQESIWVSKAWENVGIAATPLARVPRQSRLAQYGTGKHVDVIVCDQDMWFGHIEFQNTQGISTIGTGGLDVPSNYVGGNALCNRGISTTTGTCDLLDLTLDAPYYLDPDFFDANPASRLMERWDGTTVPTESAARNWWGNNSTTYRSPKFVTQGIGTGTAVPGSDFDFGTITISTLYTRARSNGSNTAYNTGGGFHGTPCASQSYGRQYGWAYNANKWFLNHYGSGNQGWEKGFDQQKVFHRCKPINPLYGTKDPTISSNSWGHRDDPWSSGTVYYRSDDGINVQNKMDGSDGANTYSGRPACLSGGSGINGDYVFEYETDNSVMQAGAELVDSGVIYVSSAGNNDQKLVNGDHPDYNNYYDSTSGRTPEECTRSSPYSSMSGFRFLTFFNRGGFPGMFGKKYDENGVAYYKTISVGAVDELGTTSGVGTYYRECKASYSNNGSGIDVWAFCDMTLAATGADTAYLTEYKRADPYYTLAGTISTESRDCGFNGTSSACPISVGLMATKLEYNRDWTWADMKGWLGTLGSWADLTDANGVSAVYSGGSESTDYNNSGLLDAYHLQGSKAPIIWDAPTGGEPEFSKLVDGGDGVTFSGDITIRVEE